MLCNKNLQCFSDRFHRCTPSFPFLVYPLPPSMFLFNLYQKESISEDNDGLLSGSMVQTNLSMCSGQADPFLCPQHQDEALMLNKGPENKRFCTKFVIMTLTVPACVFALLCSTLSTVHYFETQAHLKIVLSQLKVALCIMVLASQ